MIRIERAYPPRTSDDGTGFLVEHLRPHSIARESVNLVGGLPKKAVPSAERDTHPQAWRPIHDAVRKGDVAPYHSARDTMRIAHWSWSIALNPCLRAGARQVMRAM
ncbi:MAG: DUF488 family protein [Acidiferrobacterales bacterium]